MRLYEICGGVSVICQNTTMRVFGAWIKRNCVLCLKTYISRRLRAPAFVRRVLPFQLFIKRGTYYIYNTDLRKIGGRNVDFNYICLLSQFEMLTS